jgi:hypothetical protein
MDWPPWRYKDNKSTSSAAVTSFIGFDDDLMITSQLNFQNQRFFYSLRVSPFPLIIPSIQPFYLLGVSLSLFGSLSQEIDKWNSMASFEYSWFTTPCINLDKYLFGTDHQPTIYNKF